MCPYLTEDLSGDISELGAVTKPPSLLAEGQDAVVSKVKELPHYLQNGWQKINLGTQPILDSSAQQGQVNQSQTPGFKFKSQNIQCSNLYDF